MAFDSSSWRDRVMASARLEQLESAFSEMGPGLMSSPTGNNPARYMCRVRIWQKQCDRKKPPADSMCQETSS